MFDRFFQPSLSPTRLNTCLELKELCLWMEMLRRKNKELKEAGESKGVASIDHRKFQIINNLLERMDRKIADFNAEKPAETREKVALQIIQLVNGLRECIAQIGPKFQETLLTPRNQHKEYMNDAVNVATYTFSAIVSSAMYLSTLWSLLSFFYLAPKVSKTIRTKAGLNSKITESVRILQALTEVLLKIGAHLHLSDHLNKIDEEPQQIDSFCCLISQQIMKDPVFCILDEMSYEREAITRWLKANRRSPFNNKVMEENQTIESVLRPNRRLRDAIEEFKEKNPHLFDNEFSEGTTFKIGNKNI